MEKAKWCGGCMQELPLSAFGKNRAKKAGLQNWCRVCLKKYWREKRKANPGYQKGKVAHWRHEHPAATNAQIHARRLLKRGKITKPELCEDCQERPPQHMHHEDYSMPGIVVHLCVSCHRLRHSRNNNGTR